LRTEFLLSFTELLSFSKTKCFMLESADGEFLKVLLLTTLAHRRQHFIWDPQGQIFEDTLKLVFNNERFLVDDSGKTSWFPDHQIL
jgi:hypothetical protein